MVNQNTPYGRVYYTKGTAQSPDQWTQTVSLSPAEQSMFNQNQQINQRLGGVAQQGLGYVQSALGKPLTSDVPLTTSVANQPVQTSFDNNAGQIRTDAGDPSLMQQNVTDAIYNQNTQYLDPQFQQGQANLENQLSNQGLQRGTEAWNTALGNFGLDKQRAYESARNAAIQSGVGASQGMYGMNLAGMQAGNQALGQQYGQNLGAAQFGNQAGSQMFGQNLAGAQFGNQASAQNLAQAQALRQDPINMLNAVRSGQQMQVANIPQVGASNPAGLANVGGPDLLGAANSTYNAQLQNANAQNAANAGMTSGLFGLASAGIGAFSDMRLKRNIVKIGDLMKGIGIYLYDKFGISEIGVLAQEVVDVIPDAVMTHESGYMMVNYSRVVEVADANAS